MFPKCTVVVFNSWLINGKELIVELKHEGLGLPKGAKLLSSKTGLKWIVKSRLLFNHSINEQKRFKNETENILVLKFNSTNKMEESKTSILYNEKNDIYQYHFETIGNNKPEYLETLE